MCGSATKHAPACHRQIDDLLPEFLGLDHATPAELDGLYLALRGWPTPGRAAAPLNLRREMASVVWTQGVPLERTLEAGCHPTISETRLLARANLRRSISCLSRGVSARPCT